jgi:hypothetical protein
MNRFLSILAFSLMSQLANAGTIYKCVDSGGKPSYSDRPCGKSAVALKVEGPAGPDPQTLARLERERALIEQIEGERAVRDEQEAREATRAQRAALAQKRRCDKLRLQRKWAEEDSARAARDEADNARIKARRQAEALAVECPA